MPALLTSLPDGEMPQVRQRLAQLVARGPDPRVLDAAVGWLDDPRCTFYLGTHRFFDDVQALLCAQLPSTPTDDGRMEHWTFRGPDTDELPEAVRTEVEAWLSSLPMPPDASSDSMVIRLLQSVYDSPDDDGARSVLADRWLELGDPRGEFTALQLARHRGDGLGSQAPLPWREATLLRDHGAAWFGPAFMAHHTTSNHWFERGFPALAWLDGSMSDLSALIDEPGLRTLVSLELTGDFPLPEVARFLRSPSLSHLRSLRWLSTSVLPAMLEASCRPRHLGLRGREDASHLQLASVIEDLEGLEDLEWLWASGDLPTPGLARVRTISVHVLGALPSSEQIDEWLARLHSDTQCLQVLPMGEGGLCLERLDGGFVTRPARTSSGCIGPVPLDLATAWQDRGLPEPGDYHFITRQRTLQPHQLDGLPRAPLRLTGNVDPNLNLPPWPALIVAPEALDWALDQPVEQILMEDEAARLMLHRNEDRWEGEARQLTVDMERALRRNRSHIGTPRPIREGPLALP